MTTNKHTTGDEDVVQNLLHALLQREFVGRPMPYHRTQDISEHLQKVEEFLMSLNVTDDGLKCRIVLSTLSEDVQAELLCQPDYEMELNYILSKLPKLFKEKQTKITPLIKMLNVKQKSNQSLRDYVSELRIEAYKLMKDMPVEEREKYLITVFLNGIWDVKTATAVKSLKPTTLEEAFDMIKKEYKYANVSNALDENELAVRNIQLDSEKEDLRQEIGEIKQELKECKEMLRKLLSKNNSSGIKHPGKKSTQISCFNCKGNHFLKDCTMPKMCSICGKTNHITKFHKDFGKIRRFEEDDRPLSQVDNETSDCESGLNENNQGDFFSICNTENRKANRETYASVLNPNTNAIGTRLRKNKGNKKIDNQNDEINEIIQYVEYNGPKPKTCQTVISETHAEKARNKPIIRGILEGYRGKVFLDSGAETNIIDSDLFRKLQTVKPNLPFIPRISFMRCANNSKLKCMGVTFINVRFGQKNHKLRFLVVEHIFPRVFIGIKSMKDMRMIINPGNNCAQIEKEVFPFMSSISSETPQSDWEN